ncbi:hypothetical protein ACWCPQ_20495 [Nocardia sp. NPDC001965]
MTAYLGERGSVELETLMGDEALNRPTDVLAARLTRGHGASTVSSFVVEARRCGVDPAPLLDSEFFLRGGGRVR